MKVSFSCSVLAFVFILIVSSINSDSSHLIPLEDQLQEDESGIVTGRLLEAKREGNTLPVNGPSVGRKVTQRKALVAWANSLRSGKDYNVTFWAEMVAHIKGGPPQYFDAYIRKLSDIFLRYGAAVNFISIGACDGTNDLTIQSRYLKYPHWRGMFVEPMSNNFADLEKLLRENGATKRSFALRAAATDKCKEPTIRVQRPLFEEKNPKTPHWLRRQIGGIIAEGKGVRNEWTMEEVKCVTAHDMLVEWASNARDIARQGQKALVGVSDSVPDSGSQNGRVIRRPHILKLDVEGHDYEVLMGFVQDSSPAAELPLLINFEAKSLGDKKFKLAKKKMEERGYVVSNFASDGFALLKGDVILNPPPPVSISDASLPNQDKKMDHSSLSTISASVEPTSLVGGITKDEQEDKMISLLPSPVLFISPEVLEESGSIYVSNKFWLDKASLLLGPAEDKER